jgi:hypothetical protein
MARLTDFHRQHSPTELPPATSHGYAEWDFSGVPDPVMFRWFLTPRTTGSATLMTPAPGVTIPRGSASSCSPTTKQTPRTRQKPATEKFPPAQELDRTRVRGQVLLPLTAEGGRHQRATGSSTRA